jgi:DNA-binding transcriptional LysR family regulator
LNVFLLDKLREFHRRYPGVRLRIANHSTPQAIRALGRGLVDLCVITTPARLESTMRRTLLMPFQEILIAGRDFEFLQGRRWALKELQQYPLICLGSETMTYAFYNQFYLSNNLVLQPDTEAATTDQVVPLVKSGLGLGYVPQNFAKDALAAGDVFTIQLKEEIPTRHVVLVQDGGRVPNAAAREFARMLNSSVTQQNAP